MIGRSNRAETRNPVLMLPAMRKLQALDPHTRTIVHEILRELQDDARVRAEESWRRHKGPMAAYWKSIAVYAGHIARTISPHRRRKRTIDL